MSPQDRIDRIIVQEIEDQDAQIARREEMMALEILRTGKVIVEAPDFPRMEVDFGRPAGHSIALIGGDRWGESGISPFASLVAWAQMVHDNSGAHPAQVLLDPKAASLLLQDTRLFQILDNRRQNGGDFQFAAQVTGAQGAEVVRLGAVGQFEFWQYQQTYQDDAGAIQKMMPDYTVIMGGPGIEGYACYGAILDHASLQATSRFPSMFDQKDPSTIFAMTQSAPLPVPMRIEASFCATVR